MEKTEHANSYSFGADASKILNLVIHSLYKHKDVFLRELISNASDALNKLREESNLDQELLEDDTELSIRISFDKEKKLLEISDNGIGMSKEELIENLGTVARSGTEKFLESLKDKKVDLIGQFGVGFYSVFMVAEKVEVETRKAGTETGHLWTSRGKDNFYIDEVKGSVPRGARIRIHLKGDAEEFLDKFRIEHVITTNSNHIGFPIYLLDEKGEKEQINAATAIWTKNKGDITEEEHQNFFREVAHVGGRPWMVIHNKNEGSIEYINLLYIPSIKPFDLYNPDRRASVKLYIKKVFITEENVHLIPQYLRFLKGIVDCSDLPLNISRETLQYNNTLMKIKKSLTNRVLNDLRKKAESDPEKYISEFWSNFGAVLKEGLCEAMPTDERERLFGLCRFYSLNQGKLISLDEYIQTMKPEQKEIYCLGSTSIESAKNSPQLEGFLSRGIDVLLFVDPVDDFWINVSDEYKSHNIKSITRSSINLDDFQELEKSSEQEVHQHDDKSIDLLIAKMQEILKDEVESVRVSKKLKDSPVCLAVPDGAMDIRMERFMIEQKQLHSKTKKVLEINITHPVISRIIERLDDPESEEFIQLLYDQACILQAEEVKNPMRMAKLMNKLLLGA
ncbi:chaperone protein htpG [Neorickettsia helminthoeca str. Oregon]|uniref:Chaperone protein HtpG n=1 Tax=Neorickettsia helminthoeca str. Oregon TaxID=1286528 RepID=X5HLV4_9RICK|nr:molecular chaperone HtpG [Neorickettsia helminthoeca]AHX11410.1 chaperone protein htpG [Neorickettsia helminthoeca str. Oregon]